MTKIKFLLILFFLCFIVIISKLFYLQILNTKFSTDNNYLQTRKITPERGKIYDLNYRPLVLNQNSYLLYVEPKIIKNKKEVIEKLNDILDIDQSSLEAQIDDEKVWVAIKSGIEEDIKNKILALKLQGVGFDYGTKRYYPEASLSAHLLGFVGKDQNGEDIGYFGIEGFYNKDLQGLSGILKSERDLIGKPIFIGTQQKVDPENGRDLVLTIDKTIQEISKRKLKQGLDSYQVNQGCVIVADPNTMKLLSMVCLPDYDIDNYYRFSEEFFKNPTISEVYEPGSIFKPLIVAAALEEKKIKPNDFYNEDGPVSVGEYKIRTWNDKYEGKISITRILEKSSNVGMVYIGGKLGNDKLYEYIIKYGFGQLTSIDLQGEASSYIKPKGNWYPIDFSTVTFGQGIAVTPLQMIRAFSSIINGGKLFKPEVVNKIISSSDKENDIKPKIERKVISELTSDIMKKMLTSVVNNGEIKWAKPKGYQFGGKTGTAQIAIQGHYDPTKTIASFIGFSPVKNPKFIALVILKEPKSSQWGSETAAPLFFEIAKELLVYYNIAPDGQ